MRKQAEMSIEVKENGQYVEHIAYPYVESQHMTFENGMQIEKALEDDVAMPTVAHDTSSFKVGQGDSDVSDSIVDSSIASMTIKGQTYQNILPSPTLRNSMTDGNTMQKINEGYDSVEVVDGNVKSAILTGQTQRLPKINEYFRQGSYSAQLTPLVSDTRISSNIVIDGYSNVFIKCQVGWLCCLRTDGAATWNNEINLTLSPTAKFVAIFKKEDESNISVDDYYFEDIIESTNIKELGEKSNLISVKMPVLKTVSGFNLLNPNAEPIAYEGNDVLHPDYFKAKFGDSFSVTKNTSGELWCSLFCYDSDKNLIKAYYQNNHFIPRTITLNDDSLRDVAYVRFECAKWTPFKDIMLNYGEQMPFAEYSGEYKTNILSTPEKVVLRSLPNGVCDTLNLITGEYVQRIGEMKITDEMIDKFAMHGNFINNFNCIFDGLPERNTGTFGTVQSTISMVSDKMMTKPWSSGTMAENVVYFSQYNGIMRAYHSPDWTLDEFKEWFRENKPTIQYELATPVVKTVDLSILDQDNQPVEQLQSYANGHIQLSSNVAEGVYSLFPTIEYEVPTSNSYYVDLAKPSTQYTMKNMQGTFTIDGIQYNASANGTFTSPSTLTDKFMVASVAQSQPMLLEGDMTSEEVPYVEGIKSAFEGVDKVEIVSQNADNTLTNRASFPITNPLHLLPNGVRDEIVLDRMSNKAKLIQRVGEDLTQLATPIITEVDIEGFPYVYKDGHIFLNTEVAPMTEVKYSINQSQIIESQSEDIVRHSKEIDNLYNLIATYVQVNYDSTLLNLKTKGV